MIALDATHLEQIVAHCEAAWPNEGCGLVAGQDAKATRVIPMRNADASPTTYRLDPHEQVRVFDEIETEGLDVLAIFHSHPRSAAYPSRTDRDQATYPEAAYLIVSLVDVLAPHLRAFRIVEGLVTEEPVLMTPDREDA